MCKHVDYLFSTLLDAFTYFFWSSSPLTDSKSTWLKGSVSTFSFSSPVGGDESLPLRPPPGGMPPMNEEGTWTAAAESLVTALPIFVPYRWCLLANRFLFRYFHVFLWLLYIFLKLETLENYPQLVVQPIPQVHIKILHNFSVWSYIPVTTMCICMYLLTSIPDYTKIYDILLQHCIAFWIAYLDLHHLHHCCFAPIEPMLNLFWQSGFLLCLKLINSSTQYHFIFYCNAIHNYYTNVKGDSCNHRHHLCCTHVHISG